MTQKRKLAAKASSAGDAAGGAGNEDNPRSMEKSHEVNSSSSSSTAAGKGTEDPNINVNGADGGGNQAGRSQSALAMSTAVREGGIERQRGENLPSPGVAGGGGVSGAVDEMRVSADNSWVNEL